MSHSYTLQLHTGSFTHCQYSFEQIKEKADRILAPLNIKDVILGWSVDKELNKALVNYFHNKGIRVLLWFPILSESEQIREQTLITTVSNNVSEGVPLLHGEQFQFMCPTTLSNVHNVISIYEEHFADIDFDGIFLDKLRFPSFANGYEEGFGCFCEGCEKAMIGIDIPYLKKLIEKHDEALIKGSYDDYGIYHFEDPMVHAFYRRRANMISDYVFKLAAYFNSRKMIVGADIYAPFFAYHVGQNIKELGKLVDFVKPMFYRYTNAPAGMKYEFDAYNQYFPQSNAFSKQWQQDPTSEEAIKRQLEFLSHIPASICAGIEVNPIKGICDIDKNKVQQSLRLLANDSTVALCWDIMQMDEEILSIL